MINSKNTILSVAAVAALTLSGCGSDTPDTPDITSTTSTTSTPGATSDTISGDIASDRTLTADRTWILNGRVNVPPGVTLTIEPGTTIAGKEGTSAWLFVAAGAILMAEGTEANKITFTSEAAIKGEAEASGQWGGVTIIGNSTNPQLAAGYEVDETIFAGTDNSSSGVIKHAVFNNTGIAIRPDQEVNGLSLFGVSDSTIVDNITVNRSFDDGLEIWGGTVNVSNITIIDAGDDAFDTDSGWTGTVDGLTVTNPVYAAIEMSGTTVGTYKNVEITVNSPLSEGGVYYKAGSGEVIGAVLENVNIRYNNASRGALTVRGDFDSVNSTMTNVVLNLGSNSSIAAWTADDEADRAEIQAVFDAGTGNVQ